MHKISQIWISTDRLNNELKKLTTNERNYFEIALIEADWEFYFCTYRIREIKGCYGKKIEREIVGISEDLPEYLQDDEKERLMWKLDSLRLLQGKIIKLNFG